MTRLSYSELKKAKTIEVSFEKNINSRILTVWSVEDVLYVRNDKDEQRVILNGRLYESKKPTVNEDGIISETNGNGLKIKDIKINEYK